MSSFDLLPELAAALDRVIPPTPGFGDWSDVLRRAEPRRGSRRSWPPLRFAWALGVLLFVVVAVAAAYVILSHQASGRPRPGASDGDRRRIQHALAGQDHRGVAARADDRGLEMPCACFLWRA